MNYRNAANRAMTEILGCEENECLKLICHISLHAPKALLDACQAIYPEKVQDIILQCRTGKSIDELREAAYVSFCKVYEKISCIKFCRAYTGMGLKEAKEFIEDLQQKYDFSFGSFRIVSFVSSNALPGILKKYNFP